ncbi:MAG: cobalamin biosynthesis protein [Terrabacter sp.]
MSRPLGLALGYLLDHVLGDPRRWHPVAGFGSAAMLLEKRTYADRRGRGAAHVVVLVGATVALGALAERSARRNGMAHTLLTAAATWAVLGGRSLVREAEAIEGQLRREDLVAARTQVRNLVGRETAELDADEVARACIESLAENTSDAVVAPLLWGGLLGVPGLLGYRAVNTLDAMVGHRNERYAEFGWAAAKLDDLVNWAPARVTGVLTLAAGRSPSRAAAGWTAIRSDAPAHPSPNGGVVEAAFAGVLGVRLGGSNSYDGRVEHRGTLGNGPAAGRAHIAPAASLARRVAAGSLVVALTLAAITRHQSKEQSVTCNR